MSDQRPAGAKIEGRPGARQRAGEAAARPGRRRSRSPGSRAARPSASSRPPRRPAATPSGGRTTSPAASATRCTRSPAPTRRSPSWSRSAPPHQGREILAIKLTQGARGQTDGSRPAVLYSATQHAREWIATEVDPPADEPTTSPVAGQRPRASASSCRPPSCGSCRCSTPTATSTPSTPSGCGGRTSATTTATARSPSATASTRTATSPPTGATTTRAPRRSRRATPTAARRRVRAGDPGDGRPVRPDRLRVHGQLPLQRPVAALQRRLADRHPDRGRPDLLRDVRQPRQAGDRGLPPGPELGRPLRHQRRDRRLRAGGRRHPGLDAGALPRLRRPAGSSSPTTRRWSQAEFERNLPFARSVADSAADPDDPKTVTGIKTKPFYVDSEDAYKRGIPGVQLSFTKSYGDPQPVAVLAKRSLGDGHREVPHQRRPGAVRAHEGVGGRVDATA